MPLVPSFRVHMLFGKVYRLTDELQRDLNWLISDVHLNPK